MSQTPATVRETLTEERVRFILGGDGTLGEPWPTGRTIRLRTVEIAGRLPEVLSIEIQDVPGGDWARQAVPVASESGVVR
ncbi:MULTISPECIES: hypothetical protein [Methylobacteriaceae]|uniref:hypothetical protein n=1 Tax=Methylobacteriaceae TaxID=119045 RepID=UPI000CDB259B|nr:MULTISPECIES: hypothetical protein [Methylobacteriaceae]MCP1549436.1 hypothetical protein [Methylorubrum zatmanii]MCP1553951.1 hypothetical protein [Methylorubrum extorquens]MCP1579738.1 hypothetical protein [Methylorubrum extorquens]POR41006.1 hypothetical protein CRT23_21175 [Methylobacterium sp. V23]